MFNPERTAHAEEDAAREKQPETEEAVADDPSTLKREHLGPLVQVEYGDLRFDRCIVAAMQASPRQQYQLSYIKTATIVIIANIITSFIAIEVI